jgi:hypothetical protein
MQFHCLSLFVRQGALLSSECKQRCAFKFTIWITLKCQHPDAEAMEPRAAFRGYRLSENVEQDAG